MSAAPYRLLTEADVAERWSLSVEHVREAVNHYGLVYVPFSKSARSDTKRGRRIYRFRPIDVEAWEAAQVRQRTDPKAGVPPPPTPSVPSPPLLLSGHDGKRRLKLPRTKGRVQT